MALNNNKKSDFNTMEILLKIAAGLEAIKNPQKSLEDLYQLDEKTLARSKEALANIDKYIQLKNECIQIGLDNETKGQQLDLKLKEIDQKSAENEVRLIDINKQNRLLDEAKNTLKANQDELLRNQDKLAKDLLDIAKRESDLKSEQEEFDKYEKRVKDVAESFQSKVAGL